MWNVAGLRRKGIDFWDFICEHDLICLEETWLERKGWEDMKVWLPRSHEWVEKEARKKKKKGRAKGGMLIGKRKGWGIEGGKWCCRGEDGLMIVEIKEAKERWIIVSIYNSWEWKVLEQKIDKVLEEIEEREECLVILGGDFNIRTGELGGVKEIGIERRSKDKTVSNGGRNMIKWMQNKGWYLLNSTTNGDWEGEFTYVGAKGNTVIDYVMANEKARDRVLEFKVEVRVDSDHMPLQMKIKKKEEDKEEEEEARGTIGTLKGEAKEKEITIWTAEAIERFKKRTEVLEQRETQEGWTVEERWQWIKKVAKEAIVKKKIRVMRRRIGFKDRWDKECTIRKRKLHRCCIAWRKGKVRLEEYIGEKKKLKEILEEKQKKKERRKRS